VGLEGGEVDVAGGDAAHRVDEQSTLDRFDAFVQRVLGVTRQHGDALLHDDGAVVDAVRDDDDARARLGDAGREGVAQGNSGR
jgi:hypothetical protein